MPFLSRTLVSQGESDFLISADRTVSFRALDEAAERAARRLVTLGIRSGETVALKGHPDVALLVALHGIWKMGGVPFPMNPRWTGAEEERAVAPWITSPSGDRRA